MNILITGVSGHLGQSIVHQLLHTNPFGRVVGVDTRAPTLLGPVQYVEADIKALDLADILVLNDIEAVIHCAAQIGRTSSDADAHLMDMVLTATLDAEVPRLVVPSRDWVYQVNDEPCYENSATLDLAGSTDGDVRARFGYSTHSGWLPLEAELKTEAILSEAISKGSATDIVIPRFCPLIGRGCNPHFEAFLSSRYIVSTPNARSNFQLMHIDDAARYLVSCLSKPGLSGPYNIAPQDVLSLETVAGILEKRLLTVPTRLCRMAVALLSGIGSLDFNFTQLLGLQAGRPMMTDKMTSVLGRPKFSSRQALALWRVEHRSPSMFENV